MVLNFHRNTRLIREGEEGGGGGDIEVKQVNMVLNVHRNHKAY